jgi:hypothetical protein
VHLLPPDLCANQSQNREAVLALWPLPSAVVSGLSGHGVSVLLAAAVVVQGVSMTLAQQCRAIGLPQPETEIRFHPTRKWRADFLWREPHMLIVELDGGVYVQGRHSRGAGIEKDCEKFAEAMALGYRVMRVTPRHVRNGQALAWIEKVLTRGDK